MQLQTAHLETDMPLNDPDRAWVRETIRTAHEGRSFAGFIKEWGGVGAAVSMLLFLALQWSSYIEFRTSTGIRLDRIEKALLPLTIQAQLSLPASDFQASLPALESAVKTAKKEGVKVSPKVVSDLSARLDKTDSAAPGYWPTIAALITYRSSLVVGIIQSTIVRPCNGADMYGADKNAAAQLTTPDGKPFGEKMPITGLEENNCFIDLDGKTLSMWSCTHCIIRYSGGPVSLKDVRFSDCLFVFDFQSQQPPASGGQFLSRTLLTSDLNHVTIPS